MVKSIECSNVELELEHKKVLDMNIYITDDQRI